MKKHLLFFAMILLPMVASAHDIEVQNGDGVTIYYNYINDVSEAADAASGVPLPPHPSVRLGRFQSKECHTTGRKSMD